MSRRPTYANLAASEEARERALEEARGLLRLMPEERDGAKAADVAFRLDGAGVVLASAGAWDDALAALDVALALHEGHCEGAEAAAAELGGAAKRYSFSGLTEIARGVSHDGLGALGTPAGGLGPRAPAHFYSAVPNCCGALRITLIEAVTVEGDIPRIQSRNAA